MKRAKWGQDEWGNHAADAVAEWAYSAAAEISARLCSGEGWQLQSRGQRAADAARSAVFERVSEVHREKYMSEAGSRGVRLPAGVDWRATAASLGWLGKWAIRARNIKRMWRKLFTGDERTRKFSSMAATNGVREDGRCRRGCRCSETLWHAVIGCTADGLGARRAKFYEQYRDGLKGKGFDVEKVIRVLKQRLEWGRRGEVQVVGEGGEREVECVIFGFVPEWLARGVEQALGDDEQVDEWLKSHGGFMKKWFWGQWKEFREGDDSGDESE